MKGHSMKFNKYLYIQEGDWRCHQLINELANNDD